nr:MAG TPA: hypothetical protein [Caudoviricetes sp.]
MYSFKKLPSKSYCKTGMEQISFVFIFLLPYWQLYLCVQNSKLSTALLFLHSSL